MSSVSDAAVGAIPGGLISRLQAHPRFARVIRSAVNFAVRDEIVEVTVAQGPMRGMKLSLNLRKEKAFWLGTYESDVQQILCERLLRGRIAWDVGAFIGFRTLLMCRLCGPSNVVAVEPDQHNVLRLSRNLELNDSCDVRILPVALGAHIGRGLLQRNSIDRRQNIVEEIEEKGAGVSQGLEVDIRTLDSMLETHGSPDVIKADVEGAEDLMLQGAGRLIEEVRPFWVLEAHGVRGQSAINMLKEYGYRIEYLDKTRDSRAELSAGQEHVLAEP